MNIRQIVLVLALAAIVAVTVFSQFGALAAGKDKGKKPLELTFTNLEGKTVKLSDYRGKVVVLDVWATWCGYCVREIPDLIQYQKDAVAKKLKVQVLGVSVDTDKETVQKFVKEQGITYPIMISNKDDLKPLGNISGIPVKFIINEKGMLVDRVIGAMDRPTLDKTLGKYVKK